MTTPVGEASWVDYVDQDNRRAMGLEGRVHVIEQYGRAVSAEPGSIKIWSAYCEHYWSLYLECSGRLPPQQQYRSGSTTSAPSALPGSLSPDELAVARQTFTLDEALKLWQVAYEAVQYRLGDSHQLWNRWISLELGLLAGTRTEQGVVRVTHLFKNRLATPHTTWDETSQMFSTFLSEYNPSAYESEMERVTQSARDAKKLLDERDGFESKLAAAIRSGDKDAEKRELTNYLGWETRRTKHRKASAIDIHLCVGLFYRALTGIFADDESTWADFLSFVSSTHTDLASGKYGASASEAGAALPNMLDCLQRAVKHCPGSGHIWARYILAAEEAGLSFSDIEKIKHGATSSDQLDRDGMTPVLEMYAAWCGYLKRTAMNPSATDEAIDLADVGLTMAIEDVRVWGKRKYGDVYQGDPSFRLERIYIQYLTEKHEALDTAREQWNQMANLDIHANSYDFWLNYYLWETIAFQKNKSKNRSPTPSAATKASLHTPKTIVTEVFLRALRNRNLDWPERIMDVCIQHCNDYQLPDTIRNVLDTIHDTRKSLAWRKEKEAAAQAAYAEHLAQQQQEQQQPQVTTAVDNQGQVAQDSPSGAKRKREHGLDTEEAEVSSKRAKNQIDGTETSAAFGQDADENKATRDRENTTVVVEGLPEDTTQTRIKHYFKEYGHIRHITSSKVAGYQTAMIEFNTPDEAQSALLRDGKYYGQVQISVRSGAGLTLFVTNFPPEADDQYIRQLFKDCGDIFDIRRPSLSINTRRRFVYIDFLDPDAAAQATKLNGKMLQDGGHRMKLVVVYSDPGHKQARHGATAEGREVYVTDLPRDATEDELKDLFGKFGGVDSAKVLRNMAGVSRGSGFVVFESKANAEQAAAELDKTKFRGQILQAQISKNTVVKPTARSGARGPTTSPSPAPSGGSGGREGEGDETMQDAASSAVNGHRQPAPTRDELRARTVAVMGIPDTVNDARVRAILEPLGTITKLLVRPARGGAIVEFADANTAGRASLAIEGLEIIEGYRLRVGKVGELTHDQAAGSEEHREKGDKGKAKVSASKPGLMAPPPQVRRPTVLGGKGGKRGLGFTIAASAKKEGDTAGTNGEMKVNGLEGAAHDDAAPPAAKKSNADFKAMFLGTAEGGGKDMKQNGHSE